MKILLLLPFCLIVSCSNFSLGKLATFENFDRALKIYDTSRELLDDVIVTPTK
jgi:hypothetical protein